MHDEELDALIALHQGLDRQGPGDEPLAREILASLPPLPNNPRIADLGCGAGSASLLLARWFDAPVAAVDLSADFLADLRARAEQAGLSRLITAIKADMGALDWPAGSLDLIWSEGAAYNLTFRGALEAWRPLLADGGLAVISEIGWFTDNPPRNAAEYWRAAYPAMATEEANRRHAETTGFAVLDIRRIPAQSWWTSYYDPLRARIEAIRAGAYPAMARVIAETETEIELFARYSDAYGYSFYVLRKTGR